MIVHLPIKGVGPKSGKGNFYSRLGIELRKLGVQTTEDPGLVCDISLNNVYIKHNRSRIKILRLDNVWHDTGKNYVRKNSAITSSLVRADAVVYQSRFGKDMCDHYLTSARVPWRIINNGADPAFYEKVKPVLCKESKVFLAFSRWRPHKRLRDIIEAFLLASIPDSKLVVLGDLSKCGLLKPEMSRYLKLSNIDFVGHVDQDCVASYLKIACASIHLCWFDACPNSVVEAIVAGVPVISNNVGGTPELVSMSGGYVCKIDKAYDLSPVDLYHPPPVNRKLIAAVMKECAEKKRKIDSSRFYISQVALEYKSFMEELMCSH